MDKNQQILTRAAGVGADLFERLATAFPQDGDHPKACYGAAAMLTYLIVTNNQRNSADEALQNLLTLSGRVAEMLKAKKNGDEMPKRTLN